MREKRTMMSTTEYLQLDEINSCFESAKKGKSALTIRIFTRTVIQGFPVAPGFKWIFFGGKRIV